MWTTLPAFLEVSLLVSVVFFTLNFNWDSSDLVHYIFNGSCYPPGNEMPLLSNKGFFFNPNITHYSSIVNAL